MEPKAAGTGKESGGVGTGGTAIAAVGSASSVARGDTAAFRIHTGTFQKRKVAIQI